MVTDIFEVQLVLDFFGVLKKSDLVPHGGVISRVTTGHRVYIYLRQRPW